MSDVAGILFEACINAMFGPSRQSVAESVSNPVSALDVLCRAAGVSLRAPVGMDALCCGTIWQSKGLTLGQLEMTERVVSALWAATDGGQLPVVCDAASCSHQLMELAAHLPAGSGWVEPAQRLEVLDAVTFVRRFLADRLVIPRRLRSIAVHPTCSHRRMGIVEDLLFVANLAADLVWVPPEAGCCGFAGDRGMLHPELTDAATRPEVTSLWRAEDAGLPSSQSPGTLDSGGPSDRFSAYVSGNRTCELGMSRASGRNYRHVLEVLAELVEA